VRASIRASGVRSADIPHSRPRADGGFRRLHPYYRRSGQNESEKNAEEPLVGTHDIALTKYLLC
jgi:hypothetical protein